MNSLDTAIQSVEALLKKVDLESSDMKENISSLTHIVWLLALTTKRRLEKLEKVKEC